MLLSSIAHYRCPATGGALSLADAVRDGEQIVGGFLTSADGRRYPIEQGVPNLLYPETLSPIEESTKVEYDRVAEAIYDAAVDWQFASFLEDENAVRESMVDMLDLKPGARVLEVGAGTGRDSFRLARRLGPDGALFIQDLSPNMVHACLRKMQDLATGMNLQCTFEYSTSNAIYLPFPDGYFDAVFHFGGFNQFDDLKKGAQEFARVTKRGGRVLYGDEAVAPWLKNTEFEGIVTTNNPLFRADAPLDTVPVGARDVTVRWIIGNCFYVIAFRKDEGPPPLDLDLPHKGWRGGTMRTRYFGQVEGITLEAKALAREVAIKTGTSVHAWLDRLVREQAARELGRNVKSDS